MRCYRLQITSYWQSPVNMTDTMQQTPFVVFTAGSFMVMVVILYSDHVRMQAASYSVCCLLIYLMCSSKSTAETINMVALQDNAKTMKVQLDAQVKAVDQLKGNTRMLENKLSEAKSKKDTLKARAKSASTSKQINEMLQGLNTSSATSAFDRMEEKVMALEGESEAAMQVVTALIE